MIELVMAKLADDGTDFSDYPNALQAFFTYILKSNMRELIVFADYYDPRNAPKFQSDVVKILDPVNDTNNVADRYTPQNADAIVLAAEEAADAHSTGRGWIRR
jgi:hypothetical protein